MRPRVILLLLPAIALTLIGHGKALAAPAEGAAPLGIVLQAKSASVDSDTAQSGATVYDGDSLGTGERGTLQVRFGGSQAYLLPQSSAQVHRNGAGFGATLTQGAILLSSEDGATFRLLADGATIRPATSSRTVAQVTLVNPRELLLLSSKGSLEVSLDGEVRTLTEGNSVRMLIQPSEPAASSPDPQATPWSPTVTYQQGDVVSYNGVLYASVVNNNLGNTPGGRSTLWNRRRVAGGNNGNNGPGFGGRNRFLWVALGLVGAGVGTALALALISPANP